MTQKVAETLTKLGFEFAAAHTPAELLVGTLKVLAPVTVGEIVGLFARYAVGADGRVAGEYERRRSEFLLGTAKQIPQLIERLSSTEERVQGLDELLRERLADPQFPRVFDNFVIEGTREAIDERVRMLTYAAAEAFNVSTSIAEASRLERVLRELDPEDVTLLATMDPRREWEADSPFGYDRFDALVASGCVRMKTGLNDTVSYIRSETGDRILRLSRAYLAASTPR